MLEDDDPGDDQCSQYDGTGRGIPEGHQAEAEISHDAPNQMRLDDDHRREEQVEGSEGAHRRKVGEKSQEASKGDCNGLAAFLRPEQRECMSEDRCGEYQGEQHVPWIQQLEPDMHRQKSFRQLQEERHAPDDGSGVFERVEHARIIVFAELADIDVPQIFGEEPGKQDASRQIAEQDKKIISFHRIQLL